MKVVGFSDAHNMHAIGIIGGLAMWNDPIVDEVHQIRERQAAAVNYDIHAFFEGVRRRQNESGNPVIYEDGQFTSGSSVDSDPDCDDHVGLKQDTQTESATH